MFQTSVESGREREGGDITELSDRDNVVRVGEERDSGTVCVCVNFGCEFRPGHQAVYIAGED